MDRLRRLDVSDLVFGLVLFAVALAPRLYVAFHYAHEPVWDGHYYDFGAKRIAEGFGYSDDLSIDGRAVWHPWCHYPVGYSAFLAIFYAVLGAGARVAPAVNACTGAALAVVTWQLGRYGLPSARARIAGLVVALDPGLVLYAALVMTEPLSALLTLAGFFFAVRDPRTTRGFALGALVLGLGALVRPQTLLCAPFLCLVKAPLPPARLGRAALLASALALVPVLPWTARNCITMDGCALVSTNGGWNLAIGAFPRATGRFETLRSSDGCREATGQVQQDRCWMRYGLGHIGADPVRWLALMPAKLGYTFDAETFAVDYLHEAAPKAWPDERADAARDLTTLVYRVLLAAAAFACIAYRTQRRPGAVQGGLLVLLALLFYLGFSADPPALWPLAVFTSIVPWVPLPGAPAWPAALRLPVALLGTTVLTHAVFFGENRFHVVVVPVLCLLAAAALATRSGRTPAARAIVQ